MVNPHDDPIALVESKYGIWRRQFEDERARLEDTFDRHDLEEHLRRVDHVGSTAVPDLAAKDIVDIDVVVDDGAVTRVSELIESDLGGARHEKSNGWHPVFRRADGQRFNDHVFGFSDPGWRTSVTTKAVLRERPTLRQRYEQLKRREAAATDDLVTYSEAKSALVAELLKEARELDVELEFEIPTIDSS